MNSLSSLSALSHARSVEIAHNPVLYGKNLLPELKHLDAPLVLDANRAISKGDARALLERTGQSGFSQLALRPNQKLEASAR